MTEVSRKHIPLEALMSDSVEKWEVDRCNVSQPLNADICKESRLDKYKMTKQSRHRRIRDREPSRIPVSRVLRKLKKRTFIYRTNHPPFALNCYLYHYKHRTHSPKLRLPLVIWLIYISRLKVKNDNRSLFSNLSNWDEEAEKDRASTGFQPLTSVKYRCDALPT